MKTLKQFFCLLASCMLAFGFTACEKDGPAEGAVWDFYPINAGREKILHQKYNFFSKNEKKEPQS